MTKRDLVRANLRLSVEFAAAVDHSEFLQRELDEQRRQRIELAHERDALLAERERHAIALKKARLAIKSQAERKRFDELYRIGVGT